MKEQREADGLSPRNLAHTTAEAVARRAVACMPTTVSGHRVTLTLTLFLPKDVAEYVAARAIREGKNTPGVIADILGAESRRLRS
jgi:hypothetical protein